MISWRSGISFVAACIIAVFTSVGCLPFPLGDPAKSMVDAKLVGFWLNDAADDRELIAIYPYDEHTYLMQDQRLHKDDGKWTPQGPPAIYKAWLTEVKGHRFICLDPLFQKVVPQEHNFYPALLIESDKDGLRTRLVNADFEPLKGAKNAADELAIITKEIENPKLYDESQTNFHKLDPEKDKETVDFVVKS